MRRYDEPVEVRRGEGPEQFLWRGHLWKVQAVLSHWVETAPWWQSGAVRTVLGSERPGEAAAPRTPLGDLVTERELWRVEAGRGAARRGPDGETDAGGVFDLSFDWTDGRWSLVGCVD